MRSQQLSHSTGRGENEKKGFPFLDIEIIPDTGTRARTTSEKSRELGVSDTYSSSIGWVWRTKEEERGGERLDTKEKCKTIGRDSQRCIEVCSVLCVDGRWRTTRDD